MDVELLEDIAYLAHIVGNAAGSHYAVHSVDDHNDKLELLVNTLDPYDGWLVFDWLDEGATRILVKGVGDWCIEMVPVAQIPAFLSHVVYVPPGTYEGVGDDVIMLKGSDPDIATIVGNESEQHFAVRAWESTRRSLLVNTTDAYEGTVLLDPSTFVLEVTAVGPWTIEVKGK